MTGGASPAPRAFLAGGGEMGERIRAFDWSDNPLGPPEGWPRSLKTAVRIMLTSRQPIWVGWGPSLVYLYNDPYRAIVGGKHPEALGRPLEEVWAELWPDIEPMLTKVLADDEGIYAESQLLIMERHGYREETYYTFSFSPIPGDDGRAGGIICTNTDDTRRVIGERQLALLRELGAKAADARTWESACARSVEALASNPRDLPFAALYLSEPDGSVMTLAGTAGVDGHEAVPDRIAPADGAPWPVFEAARSRQIIVREDLEGLPALPSGAWDEAPRAVAIVPIAASGDAGRPGALVVGLNPRRLLDDGYRNFLTLVAGQIAACLGAAQAYEEERRRAEELAALDEAKTAFFSNVSHEFRTPLTLMLGPVEDMLERRHTELAPATTAQLEVVHRNGLRLLKLVNTMLDFSRIEAGRMQARFEPVELGALTADLASVFRAAVERAGMTLQVSCPPLSGPVHVDRDMWEKVVLNLLSNAFKFTLEGEIAVRLEEVDGGVRLTVRDTGVGIPPEELPRVFDRFHRVVDPRGRSHEGTGIGLSLVRELVRLHGGEVGVESEVGAGTRFEVTVPFGVAHLPADQVRREATERALPGRSNPFVEEALRWLPDGDPRGGDAWARDARERAIPEARAPQETSPARVLLADDNADMREYIERLLSERFVVEAVDDGQAALEAARARRPDLVLSDVMMPKLDGFGLLRALRSDPALGSIPVILLSARAGEEARVEGMEAGADDYLIKPFTARELVARVTAHVEMARARREANREMREQQERLRIALETGRLGAFDLDLATGELTTTALFEGTFGLEGGDLDRVFEVVHPGDRERFREAMERAVRDGADYDVELRLLRPGEPSPRWVITRGRALHDAEGGATRLLGVTLDITERKQVEEALRASEQRFRTMADTAPAMLWITEPDGSCSFLSRGWYEHTGQTEAHALGFGWLDAVHPDDRARSGEIFRDANARRIPFALDYRLRSDDGIYRWAIDAGRPRFSADGAFLGFIGSVIDVHERKEAEEALREGDRRKDEFLATLAHELRNPLAPMRTALSVMDAAEGDGETTARARATLERQLVHMVRLIDDLLDVSRISRGKLQLRKERVDLVALAEEALETARPLCAQAEQTLSHALSAEPLPAFADPTRVVQILGNLLSNACKYTPRGGSVRLELTREGDEAVARVIDDGVGLTPEQRELIFDMFAQVDVDGPGGLRSGLGIGLTLVRSLVEMHDGTIEVESEGLGRGSTFTVRVPAAEPARAALEPSRPSPARGAPRQILVVDDNEDAAEMLEVLLRRRGHSVRVVHDGLEAVRAAGAYRPEVILLDIGLPAIDGYEACRRIRSEAWGRDMLVIALTGWGQAEDRRKSAEAGFDHHLVKPVDVARLEALL